MFGDFECQGECQGQVEAECQGQVEAVSLANVHHIGPVGALAHAFTFVFGIRKRPAAVPQALPSPLLRSQRFLNI